MARLLIIDPRTGSRRILSRLFQMQGHAVAVVSTVAEAMALCGSEGFDLLVCDGMTFADGSGFELMRALAKKCGLKGIAIDGDPAPLRLEEAFAAGFGEYLTKPVLFTRLEEAIQHLSHDDGRPAADSPPAPS